MQPSGEINYFPFIWKRQIHRGCINRISVEKTKSLDFGLPVFEHRLFLKLEQMYFFTLSSLFSRKIQAHLVFEMQFSTFPLT